MPVVNERVPGESRQDHPRRTFRIALRVWDLAAWCREVVRGVQGYALDHPGWKLYVDSGPPRTCRLDSGDLNWDGVIAQTMNDIATWRRVSKAVHGRVVAITANPPPLKHLAAVRVDESKVADFIVAHLRAGGFRRLAYYHEAKSGLVDLRERALVEMARAENYPCEVLHQFVPHAAIRIRRLTRWVKRLQKPVGVVTWNMAAARDVVEACRRASVSIPAEAAIVSWDDDPMLAETAEPTITGVVLPAQRLGHEAAALLDRLLHGEPAPNGPILIEPCGVLHVRQSSDVSALADRQVFLASQYMREHAGEHLNIQQVAASLSISQRKLELDFLRVKGYTPHEELLRIKVERAKQMLAETDWTIERVASRSGLGAKQTLYRAFLKREGMTPAAYRKRFGI